MHSIGTIRSIPYLPPEGKTMKHFHACTAFVVGLLLATTLCASGCAPQSTTTAKSNTSANTSQASSTQEASITCTVTKHERFDSAVTSITSDNLIQAGFTFGDSCNITFNNGFTLNDIPFYDGYYVERGAGVIVAYPNDPFVTIAYNNAPLWSTAGLENGTEATITLAQAGKYRNTYDALSQSYSLSHADYETDEQFANFRALSCGNLKENFLYRGASPVDNSRNRAATVDALLQAYNIGFVLDLADTSENMQTYFASDDFSSYYTKNLYESGNDVVLGMASDYEADAFKASIATGMRSLTHATGPSYIHCMEGKDRTGFVCMLIEALAGASYEQMCNDYMTTYANYYHITEQDSPERYQAVKDLYCDGFARYFCSLTSNIPVDDISTEQLPSANYQSAARSYLELCGMNDEEIDALVTAVCAS